MAFTGSTAAGRQVAAACAANLTRVSLELGGKSAAIVLDDADPAAVAAGARVAGLMNGGQACVAQTRFLVPESPLRRDGRRAGGHGRRAPRSATRPTAATEIGPLVARRQQERVRDYIEVGQKEGARLVVGGADLPDGVDRGWYVRPTLFADVDNDMRIAREEIFGPVLSVIPYRDEDEALSDRQRLRLRALGFGVDGRRRPRPRRSPAGSAPGTFGVNQPYSMDPAAPFGGMKASGFGRELGPEGLDEFLDTKAISVAPAP